MRPNVAQVAERYHPGFEEDKQAYWRVRDELLAKYAGKWVAVHKGRVVAVGDDLISVAHKAVAQDGYAYTNKVGEEDKIVVRTRRVTFPYDGGYGPVAMPRVTAVVRNPRDTRSKRITDAIPDTGADVTCLPEPDCQDLNLYLYPCYAGVSHAFDGSDHQVTFCAARVEIDGELYESVVEPVSEPERLIGRDVLNQLRVTFDGPAGQTTIG